MPNKNKNTEMPQCVQTDVTSRTFKCLGCKNYSIKVINEKGGTSRVCNAKTNDPRVIVDLDASKCTDYSYGW